MKRFSDLQNQDNNSNIDEQYHDNLVESNDFPEYMIYDTNFIGYQDENLQSIVYRAAEFGTIITGNESVLDVGCGRGDFGNYLLQRYPSVNYTGVDFNNLMVQVGNQKYRGFYNNEKFNLIESIFNDNFNNEVKYDYVYHITDMTVDYGIWPNLQTDGVQYEFLKNMIIKSYDLCNVGMVFMLLNDKEYNEGYISYSLSPVSKVLYDLNLKFAIDNTDIPNVFKLVVLKESFY